jgi:thiamine kinase-like enzyme
MPGHSIDVFSNSLALYKRLIDNPSDKPMLKKALALYDQLNKDGVRKVLSHNDLHRSNLLWDNKYYFLDWEYSGLNHPCFDIASLVKSFQLNQSQITELSNGYKGNKQLFQVDTLNQWIEFIYYLEEIWRLSVKNLEDLKA